jgi:hypothetical protein
MRPLLDSEVEFSWIMHGEIFYYGVRDLIYESTITTQKDDVIGDAVEAFMAGLQIKLHGYNSQIKNRSLRRI